MELTLPIAVMALFPFLTSTGCTTPQSGPSIKPGLTTVNLGGNLEGIADWSRSNVFADLMKQGRGFGLPSSPWSGKVKTDANGWPLEDFGIVLGSWQGSRSIGGTYKISFRCAATPTIGLAASPGDVRNVVRSAAGLVTADLAVPADSGQLMLSFTNTNGGVKDLKILRPGCTSTDIFTKPFLEHCSRFSTFRFMDFESTNGSPVKKWTDRTLPAAPTYANGGQVPWEVCIALCNKLKRDAWVNVPHQADDAYVRGLAQLLHRSLNPALHLYVEYSNEVWNWGFAQATWNKNQAAADVAAGDPDLNFDKVNDKNVWTARRIGKRIKTISDIFRKEYGDAGWTKSVRPVLATQVAWPAFWLVDALTFLNSRFGPPDKYLYACAGAPYFNLGDADKKTNLSEDDVLHALDGGVDAFSTDLNVETCGTLARYYNLKFLGYEGGPDTFGSNNVAAKKAASLDPRMQAICVKYLQNWYGYGFDLINWFVVGATNYDSQYGTWGLTDDMTNQSAPKIKAVDQILAARVFPLTEGIPVPGPIDPRRFAMRDEHWSTSGALILSPTDWRGSYRDYLIRVPARGGYKVLVDYAEVQTGARLECWLNNRKVGSADLPTAGPDQKPKTQLLTIVAIPAGMNVLRLKIVSGTHIAINCITIRP